MQIHKKTKTNKQTPQRQNNVSKTYLFQTQQTNNERELNKNLVFTTAPMTSFASCGNRGIRDESSFKHCPQC